MLTEQILFLPLILAVRGHEAGITHAYWVIISCGFMLPKVFVTGFVRSWMPFILKPIFLLPLWSLKHFSTAKEPFNKDIFSFFSFLFSGKIPGSQKLHACSVLVFECEDFLVACYVLTTGPKANQTPSFTWCSDLRVTANQIILHIFQEQSRGLHTWLATVNHKRPFSDFSSGEGGLYTCYHCLANQLFASAKLPLANHDILLNLIQ